MKSQKKLFSQLYPLHFIRETLQLFKYSRRAVGLVWDTSRSLTAIFAVLTLVGGLLPAVIALVGKLIVDSVVNASQSPQAEPSIALGYVALEALAIALLTLTQRGLSVSQSLLRVVLGQKVNELILEKALTLDLAHFEDSEFYNKMTRARREASYRPLSLFGGTFKLVQDTISLGTYGALLLQFSIWAVVILAIAAIPPFIAETRFAGEAFRLFQWRAPETRQQNYLENLIAREDHAKEVQLYQLGPIFLQRYRNIFQRIYSQDRQLALRPWT